MPKNLRLQAIRDKRSYSPKELANALGVHIRTVQDWYRNGLPIIEGTCNPFLILGKDAKAYIRQKELQRRVTLGPDECYCLGCRKAVVPMNQTTYSNHKTLGGNKESVVRTGACPLCHRNVFRLSSITLLKGEPIHEKSQTQMALSN